jgi:hypothetical protein
MDSVSLLQLPLLLLPLLLLLHATASPATIATAPYRPPTPHYSLQHLRHKQ